MNVRKDARGRLWATTRFGEDIACIRGGGKKPKTEAARKRKRERLARENADAMTEAQRKFLAAGWIGSRVARLIGIHVPMNVTADGRDATGLHGVGFVQCAGVTDDAAKGQRGHMFVVANLRTRLGL